MSTVAIVLITLWLVTLANGYNMGGYIHILPLIVVVGGIVTYCHSQYRKRRSAKSVDLKL